MSGKQEKRRRKLQGVDLKADRARAQRQRAQEREDVEELFRERRDAFERRNGRPSAIFTAVVSAALAL